MMPLMSISVASGAGAGSLILSSSERKIILYSPSRSRFDARVARQDGLAGFYEKGSSDDSPHGHLPSLLRAAAGGGGGNDSRDGGNGVSQLEQGCGRPPGYLAGGAL